ncbi:MAG TPA: hypothetical protein VGA51_03820 [Casimicrobiaceae bacterium]
MTQDGRPARRTPFIVVHFESRLFDLAMEPANGSEAAELIVYNAGGNQKVDFPLRNDRLGARRGYRQLKQHFQDTRNPLVDNLLGFTAAFDTSQPLR